MKKFSITIPMFSVKYHGGTRIILQLANSFVENGHNVTIVTPKDKYSPIYPINEKVKVRYTSRVGNNRVFYLKTLVEFIFKIPKSDFILANFFPTLYVSFLAQKLKKGKVIYFPQGIGENHPSFKMPFSQILRSVEMLSFKINVLTVVTSKWQKNIVLKLNKNNKIEKISLGLLENTFYPDFKPIIDNENKKILYFVRKEKNKGLYDFLDALNILTKKNIKFDLWLFSKEKESLSKFNFLKNKLGIKVLKILNDEDLRKIYSNIDFLVNSSWREGFALPPLEAMACGTPSVITDSGGPREYAIHNYNCLIVPPKRPNLLANAILKMLLNNRMRVKLGHNAIETARKFRFSNTAEKFEKFLLSLTETTE